MSVEYHKNRSLYLLSLFFFFAQSLRYFSPFLKFIFLTFKKRTGTCCIWKKLALHTDLRNCSMWGVKNPENK